MYANDEELEKAKSQVEQGLGQESDERGESEQGESESGEDEGQGQGQDQGQDEDEGEGEGQMSGQGGVNLDDLPQPVGGVIDMKGEEGQDLTPQEVREEQTRLTNKFLWQRNLKE